MRVSWKWLGSFVDLSGYSPQQLADILTQGGVETGAVESLHPGFSQVVIGEIVSVEKHARADALIVCSVSNGRDACGTIVTGATNVFVGDKVALALPGAVLPGLERAVVEVDLRGVISSGMLCSEKELALSLPVGIERSRDGIMILPADAPVGGDLAEYLELDDWVLDLELYPNRPDCLAMIHVAQEVGALIDRKAVLPERQCSAGLWPSGGQEIIIEATDWSQRYSALVAENIVIEPSPMWLQNRLRAAGVRPINNIVDLTNYCMLEYGQPLHAFDLDKITGDITVRRARCGESMMTLDGVLRDLAEDMLVIADGSGPVAIAGVMGGLATEVTEATRRVLFESAHFQGACVRRTSRRLGLRSESSLRFEKSVDVTGAVATLERLADLLLDLNAGRPVGFNEKIVAIPSKTTICLDISHVEKVLGVAVGAEEVRQTMERQEFVCRQRSNAVLDVEIPSYRQDLKITEDLIEEVARMIGYDKIPTTSARIVQTQGVRSGEQIMRRRIRRALLEAGQTEVISYAFVHQKDDADWGQQSRQIPLINPLRDEMSVMRTSLVPGLLSIVSRNMSRQSGSVSLFEIGNVYLAKHGPVTGEQPMRELPDEVLKIAGAICGRGTKHWFRTNGEYDFFYMKGILETLAALVGVSLELSRPEPEEIKCFGDMLSREDTLSSEDISSRELLHPGRSAVISIQGKPLGFLGELHPLVARQWDLRQPVVFELDFLALAEAAQTLGHNLGARTITAKGYPRYPSVQRDLAFVTATAVPAGAIEEKIRELGGVLLTKVDIFDVYTGSPVPTGYKSLAFSLHYQSNERTLTDEEVNEANQTILLGIQQEFGAERRKT